MEKGGCCCLVFVSKARSLDKVAGGDKVSRDDNGLLWQVVYFFLDLSCYFFIDSLGAPLN